MYRFLWIGILANDDTIACHLSNFINRATFTHLHHSESPNPSQTHTWTEQVVCGRACELALLGEILPELRSKQRARS